MGGGDSCEGGGAAPGRPIRQYAVARARLPDAHPPSAYDILAERLSKLAQRYREEDRWPVLANASLAELTAAYCLRGVAVEATG